MIFNAKFNAKIFALILALFFSACAHSIHEVHTSDFSPGAAIESGEMVKGSGEQFVILGFVQQTNYVNQAYHQTCSLWYMAFGGLHSLYTHN